jgi:hypothetical protein
VLLTGNGPAEAKGQAMPASIPTVRLLGVTWADRGWRYWNRRFWLALVYALFAAFEVGLAVAIWLGFTEAINSRVAKVAVLGILGVLIGGGFIWAFRTLWSIAKAEYRHDIPTLREIATKNAGRNRKRAGAAGLGLGAGGLAGSPVAMVSLMIGTFAILGWAFVTFVMALMPYLSVEEYLAAHDLKNQKRR